MSAKRLTLLAAAVTMAMSGAAVAQDDEIDCDDPANAENEACLGLFDDEVLGALGVTAGLLGAAFLGGGGSDGTISTISTVNTN